MKQFSVLVSVVLISGIIPVAADDFYLPFDGPMYKSAPPQITSTITVNDYTYNYNVYIGAMLAFPPQ